VSRAFERLGVRHRVVTHEVADFTVVRTERGEVYVPPALAPIPLPERLSGPAVVLSPIAREVDPCSFPPVDGLLVIDIQGFVREPGVRSDRVKGPYHLAPLLSRADLVKASALEQTLLDDESAAALRRTTALITEGERGARLLQDGRETFIAARPVRTENTIGAGDSFLAAMTWALVCGRSMEVAATEAARFTEAMLRDRERRGR
jgi:hypothetical protein